MAAQERATAINLGAPSLTGDALVEHALSVREHADGNQRDADALAAVAHELGVEPARALEAVEALEAERDGLRLLTERAHAWRTEGRVALDITTDPEDHGIGDVVWGVVSRLEGVTRVVVTERVKE
jgi:hypothetical protein